MAGSIIRKFVIKQLSKDRGSGIMEIPNRYMVDQRQLSLQNYLLKKGVDPNSIQSEGQLTNILQQIEKNRIATGLKKAEAQKKMAEIMDMKGRKIKNPQNIMGGEEVGMFDNIYARMKKDMDKGRFKTVKKKETEKEIAERIKKENKEAVDRIKKDKDFDFDQDPEFAKGGRAGLSYLLAEDTNERAPFAAGNLASKLMQQIIKKYKGKVDDKLLSQMLADRNPQRLAEVMATIDEALIMQGKGMKPDQIISTVKESFKRKKQAEGGITRVPFAAGGVDKLRRLFLKVLGAGAATAAGVKSGILSFGGRGGKRITKEIIKTDNVPGKPEWFDALVTRVIKEGDEVTKKFATKEREIVHSKKLDDDTNVMVTQDLDEGTVRVEYDSPENVYGDPIQLQYKKPLPDEGNPNPSAEFDVAESGPVGRQYGPDDYEIEIDEVGGTSIEDLTSDVSKLKEYATGKKQTLKEFVQSKKRKDRAKAISEGGENEMDEVIRRQGEYDGPYEDDFASGGIARLLGE